MHTRLKLGNRNSDAKGVLMFMLIAFSKASFGTENVFSKKSIWVWSSIIWKTGCLYEITRWSLVQNKCVTHTALVSQDLHGPYSRNKPFTDVVCDEGSGGAWSGKACLCGHTHAYLMMTALWMISSLFMIKILLKCKYCQ